MTMKHGLVILLVTYIVVIRSIMYIMLVNHIEYSLICMYAYVFARKLMNEIDYGMRRENS